MERRMLRHSATRLFEPCDRFACARAQQMHPADLDIKMADEGITRAEPDGLLDKRDRLLWGPGERLALAERNQSEHRVAIGGEHRLVLGNGFGIPTLRAKDEAPGSMHKIAVRRCGRGLLRQGFGAR